MALDLENLIQARFEAKIKLEEAQQKVRSTSDNLLQHCLEHKRPEFLMLDEAALRRYNGR